MRAPKIVASSEQAVEARPPPPRERITAHKWLGEKARTAYSDHEDGTFPLYVSKLAEEKMRNHAIGRVADRLEVMGLMLGQVFDHEGQKYGMVRDVATTDLEASSVRVRFRRDGFERLFTSLEDQGYGYIVLGWYHSHPGHGVFMSPTDVETQRSMFTAPYHSAIVIDPVNKEIGAFRLRRVDVDPLPFAVYWDEHQSPYYGTSVRRRVVDQTQMA